MSQQRVASIFAVVFERTVSFPALWKWSCLSPIHIFLNLSNLCFPRITTARSHCRNKFRYIHTITVICDTNCRIFTIPKKIHPDILSIGENTVSMRSAIALGNSYPKARSDSIIGAAFALRCRIGYHLYHCNPLTSTLLSYYFCHAFSQPYFLTIQKNLNLHTYRRKSQIALIFKKSRIYCL